MTKEEKQLLLQDLCMRLPYGIKFTLSGDSIIYTMKGIDLIVTDEGDWEYAVTAKGIEPIEIEYVKPYLRPMSSMTQDEIDEYFLELNKDEELLLQAACDNNPKHRIVGSDRTSTTNKFVTHFGNDWLNAHHFDYRRLIEKGLALEALEDMYNNK